eukprot:gene2686-3882_t
MLTAGTVYIFPVISVDLRNILGFSLVEANVLFSLSLFGAFVGIPTGIFYDYFGTRFTCLLAGVLTFMSYTLIQLTVRGYLYHHPALFAFYYLMVGFGSAAQNIVGTGTNSKNFSPQRKGLVLAIVLLFFGLSGAVLSPIYNLFEGPSKLANYYTFFSIIGLTLSLINAIFHTEVNWKETDESKVSAEQESINSEQSDTHATFDKILDEKIPDTSTFGMFLTLRFYLIVLTWGIASGSGLMFINNLGEIIVSVNGPEGAATYMVPLALLGNCTGRIFGGITIDFFGKWITRPYFMLFCCLGASLTSLFSAFANFEMLFFCTILQGFFLGLSMLVGVALPMDMFGPTYYGTNYTSCLVGPAAANFLFSTIKFSLIYNSNILPGDFKCYSGHTCFMWSFIVVSILCLFGAILSLIMALTTKRHYKTQN